MNLKAEKTTSVASPRPAARAPCCRPQPLWMARDLRTHHQWSRSRCQKLDSSPLRAAGGTAGREEEGGTMDGWKARTGSVKGPKGTRIGHVLQGQRVVQQGGVPKGCLHGLCGSSCLHGLRRGWWAARPLHRKGGKRAVRWHEAALITTAR